MTTNHKTSTGGPKAVAANRNPNLRTCVTSIVTSILDQISRSRHHRLTTYYHYYLFTVFLVVPHRNDVHIATPTKFLTIMTQPTRNQSICIEGIFACSEASGEMISQSSATLIQGVGLEGDRYAKQAGTYSVLTEPGRQLTLISADGVENALSGQELPSIGCLRRNVVLRGISAQDLQSAIGSVVQFGDASCTKEQPPRVFVHRNCVPW